MSGHAEWQVARDTATVLAVADGNEPHRWKDRLNAVSRLANRPVRHPLVEYVMASLAREATRE